MQGIDAKAIAQDLTDAYATCATITAPSSLVADFDLAAGYAVEAELVRMRRAAGHETTGLKIGFANKAVWRALKLETLAWAHMYDDTVHYTQDGAATLAIGRMCQPKIEPEIIFKMKRRVADNERDPAAVLAAVESLALGFEIIDCVYTDWKFQPADFIAAFGFHAGLIVGELIPIEPAHIPALVEQLTRFKVKLLKNGEVVQEGSGRNVLKSPALCLAELASAMPRNPAAEPLAAGDLISTGTLTENQFISAGETWSATVEGIDLPSVSVVLTA